MIHEVARVVFRSKQVTRRGVAVETFITFRDLGGQAESRDPVVVRFVTDSLELRAMTGETVGQITDQAAILADRRAHPAEWEEITPSEQSVPPSDKPA